MFSAMASVALPIDAPATERTAGRIRQQLRDGHRIEVTVVPFAGRLWLRLSAYLYNELEDYERLADTVMDSSGDAPRAASL
jgi:isopenicillin-N epimerase